jgi:probable phosphoglycerate mutase
VTIIGWIRHGITDWNAERRVQGQRDIGLNEIGRSQARALAQRLKAEETWDVLYSSDLSRAKETADMIGEALGLPVITDRRLRERSFGELEGTTLEERILRWGEDWETKEFGKESEEQMAARGMSFMNDLIAVHRNQRVLVVSHGAFIAAMLKMLIPELNTEERLENTSLSIAAMQQDGWICRLYNCTKHIDGNLR